jgi:Prenyltransferase and squalene oxidase repeat
MIAPFAFAFLVATHDPSPEAVRAAVGRALPSLQRAATVHAEERTCFGCHNQAYPMLALASAKRLGFDLDPALVREQVKHLRGFIAEHRKDWAEKRGTGGQVDTAGWLLATLGAAGEKPDDDTRSIANYVLARHADKPTWTASSNRPPTQASSFTTSWLAVRSLKGWGADGAKDAIAKRIETARDWALKTPAKDTEDRVYRLRILKDAGAADADVAAAAKELLDSRRADGGWGQTPKMASDPYATATVLAALAEAGGLSPTAREYREGVRFLLRTQRSDGTWHVAARAKPIQPYYEGGYPYEKDQFLSSTAASWAVIALAAAVEK